MDSWILATIYAMAEGSIFQFHWMDSSNSAPEAGRVAEDDFQFHWMDSVVLNLRRILDELINFQFHWMDSILPSPDSNLSSITAFNSIEWILAWRLRELWGCAS